MDNFGEKVTFVWSVADLLRDAFKRSKYPDVILPFTVLRRIDCVLEPTKPKVLEVHGKLKGKLDNLAPQLRRASGFSFYNTSPYTFESLCGDAKHLAANLKKYINSFSDNMREVIEKFDFHNTISKLEEAGLLFLVTERFKNIDLHPAKVSNLEMGYVFEKLIRKFNEAMDENPGEHFTPREVIRLMVNLLLTRDKEALAEKHIVRTVYDCCCGSGGMLTIAKDRIQEINSNADVHLFGQEVNPETFAVCKSDLFMKSADGRDAENIKFGSTLGNDQHGDKRFDYLLTNPPFGKEWKMDQTAVQAESDRGYAGRFGAGTPRISDGQLLFLQHLLSRMKEPSEGGSRVAIVMNGSPLFTGDAGGGESEIRRWILENDWLEAIVALPEQLFYNTGIPTYVWVLTNRKPKNRKNKVQLIDATGIWTPMRKSLGDKRREISPVQIGEITRLFESFRESPQVRIFKTSDFGYRKITVDRPLRLNFQASPERIERILHEKPVINLTNSKKKGKAGEAEIEAGRKLREAILEAMKTIDPNEVWKNRKEFTVVLEKALGGVDGKPPVAEITKRGALDVLRKGVKDSGCKFQMAYFKPSTGLNQDTQKLYAGNQFTVIRQLNFSEKTGQSLDAVLFLNGLPIFTAELKNPLTGQSVENAISQYKKDRDPREPLFVFGRCLAHFAVDPDLVYMTTHLQKEKTRFLPFNKGRNGGAGNPPSALGFATAYLWEQTWAKDSVLDLIQNFIQVAEEEDDKGKKTGNWSLIFPRYHQLDCVRRLVADCRKNGAGQRYLIQHSAGSGKSNSIAWLAHQLSCLHDDQEKRVFDSIIVITDRRILDRQLQRTVRSFEQTLGLVENIDTTSRQLKQALEDGKTIIVTTLQKFPVIAKDMGEMPGKRFAVVIDEAHSSQSGETTKGWKTVLSVKSLENDEGDEEDGEDLEDKINEEAKKRGRLPNVSIFAFTATPKPKTMELFGVKRDDGKHEPFSLYTMRQAIEECFILDVLQNYTTYQAYWSLLKKITADPRYERTKAYAMLRSFVEHHEATIRKKVAIMVDHFMNQSMDRIGGKAKAMIVCRSRPQAVLYKRLVDAYLKRKGRPFKALVAFSGAVKYKGIEYTESGMNSTPDERIGEAQTAEAFKRDEYRFLIVANKFQTGFDQPLLHTIYVDKKLGGVNAVQTLSRLNRTCPLKEETLVLDFANDPKDIQKSFQPYYDRTLLRKGTDPHLLYGLETRLANYHFYTATETDGFAAV